MEGYKERKAIIDKTKRMVVKVGTGVLTKENGELDIERIKKLVKQIVDIKKSGREIVLVTSGAIAGGIGRIGLRGRPDELPIHLKQTCAAIGQIELMKQYGMEFSKYGIIPAQVLITEEDLQNEEKYRNLWTTLSTLIAMGAIPIINENDVVSTHELEEIDDNSLIKFGDNDKLSALVARRIYADLLIILTTTDGYYVTRDGKMEIVKRIKKITPTMIEESSGKSSMGRGGIKSKLRAAAIAMNGGVHVIIANGTKEGILNRILEGEEEGTIFISEVDKRCV